MRVLETRETPDGFRRRRYESATGRRFSTIEVPMELWQRVNSVGSQRNRAAQVMRALDRKSLQRQVRAYRVAHPDLSQRELARQLGLPESTVRRFLK